MRLHTAAILGAAGVIGMAGVAGAAVVYSGNGATGFGGTLGNGSLTISNTPAGVINFSFSAGTDMGNDAVIYIDSVSGGVNDTSTLVPHDVGDGGQTAVTGDNAGSSPSRTVATFASGFNADYAISLENSFAGLFSLTSPTITYVTSGGLSGSGSGPYTFSLNASDLGLAPGGSFNFVASLISESAYRSNETIGTSVTVPSNGSDPNAGYTGTTTFSDYKTYTVAVPEPASLSLLALAGAGVLGIRRRRR